MDITTVNPDELSKAIIEQWDKEKVNTLLNKLDGYMAEEIRITDAYNKLAVLEDQYSGSIWEKALIRYCNNNGIFLS